MPQIETTYILSAGRSGSTLLNLIIGSHPRAVTVGEVSHLPKNLALNSPCSCGQPVWECPFWAAATDALSRRLRLDLKSDPYTLDLGFMGGKRIVDPARQTTLYRTTWKVRQRLLHWSQISGLPLPKILRKRFDLGVANTIALYEVIREQTGARLVADSSKEYLKGLALYAAAPERTRLILLSRDGRAVFYSGIRSGSTPNEALRMWQAYYQRTLPLIEKLVPREQIFRLSYENLAANPEREARRVCDFLGLEFTASMLDFGSKVQHIANGNDMRLSRNQQIVADLAWQTELSQIDARYFETHAGSLNRLLGYT